DADGGDTNLRINPRRIALGKLKASSCQCHLSSSAGWPSRTNREKIVGAQPAKPSPTAGRAGPPRPGAPTTAHHSPHTPQEYRPQERLKSTQFRQFCRTLNLESRSKVAHWLRSALLWQREMGLTIRQTHNRLPDQREGVVHRLQK